MAGNQTRPTDARVEDYLAARGSEPQRADARALIALLQNAARQPPRTGGPSLVGVGSYRYTHASGHSGEAALARFATRGRAPVIYRMAESDGPQALRSALGPHRRVRSCRYVRRLADLDRAVLQPRVDGSVAEVRRRYGSHAGA